MTRITHGFHNDHAKLKHLLWSEAGHVFDTDVDFNSQKIYLDQTNLPNTYIWEDGTNPIFNFDTGDQLVYDISANQFLFKIGGTTELSLSSTELNLYTNNIRIDGDAQEGHIQIGGGYRWIGLKTRNNGYSWAFGDDANETLQISKYDHGISTWDWGVIAIASSTGNVQIKHNLKVLGNLNMDNRNIDDVASIDGGGDAVVFDDNIQILRNGATLILKTSTQDGADRPRIKFDNNNQGYFYGDDHAKQVFGFVSGFSGTRTYDAEVRIHGKATTSWGKYLQLTHDGADGIIGTDAGDIKFDPAGDININDNLIKDPTFVRVGVSANHTTSGETFIGCDSSGGSFTITLATADCISGRVIIIKDEAGSANTYPITIATEGTETIDGDNDISLAGNYSSCRLYSDGSNWHAF